MLNRLKTEISLLAPTLFKEYGFPLGVSNPDVAGDILNKDEVAFEALKDIREWGQKFDMLIREFREHETWLMGRDTLHEEDEFWEAVERTLRLEAIKQILLYGYVDMAYAYIKQIMGEEIAKVLSEPTRPDFTTITQDPRYIDKTVLTGLKSIANISTTRDVVERHKAKYRAIFDYLSKHYLPPETTSKILKAVYILEEAAAATNRDDIPFYHALTLITDYAKSHNIPINVILTRISGWLNGDDR